MAGSQARQDSPIVRTGRSPQWVRSGDEEIKAAPPGPDRRFRVGLHRQGSRQDGPEGASRSTSVHPSTMSFWPETTCSCMSR
jgi:hypothetical protein